MPSLHQVLCGSQLCVETGLKSPASALVAWGSSAAHAAGAVGGVIVGIVVARHIIGRRFLSFDYIFRMCDWQVIVFVGCVLLSVSERVYFIIFYWTLVCYYVVVLLSDRRASVGRWHSGA
jgi:hypothetical protein